MADDPDDDDDELELELEELLWMGDECRAAMLESAP